MFILNLLLHCCCSVCSVETIKAFEKEHKITLFWFNPNIHPYTEYKNRLNSLIRYKDELNLKLFVEDFYGLRFFIKNLNGNFNNRCFFCYFIRLKKTAEFAKKNGFNCFSTTLTFSPFQNHELIKKAAEQSSKKFNILFLYKDLTKNYRKGIKTARETGHYMQKYCGCIFSEEERYLKKD